MWVFSASQLAKASLQTRLGRRLRQTFEMTEWSLPPPSGATHVVLGRKASGWNDSQSDPSSAPRQEKLSGDRARVYPPITLTAAHPQTRYSRAVFHQSATSTRQQTCAHPLTPRISSILFNFQIESHNYNVRQLPRCYGNFFDPWRWARSLERGVLLSPAT